MLHQTVTQSALCVVVTLIYITNVTPKVIQSALCVVVTLIYVTNVTPNGHTECAVCSGNTDIRYECYTKRPHRVRCV